MSQMQPKGSTIGLLKDGKTVQQEFDDISNSISPTSVANISDPIWGGSNRHGRRPFISRGKF